MICKENRNLERKSHLGKASRTDGVERYNSDEEIRLCRAIILP